MVVELFHFDQNPFFFFLFLNTDKLVWNILNLNKIKDNTYNKVINEK